MLQRSPKCPKCQHGMELGFVPDATYGGVLVPSWIEGAPEKNWLGGVTFKGKQKLAVTTYRCTSCGFLESYATT